MPHHCSPGAYSWASDGSGIRRIPHRCAFLYGYADIHSGRLPTSPDRGRSEGPCGLPSSSASSCAQWPLIDGLVGKWGGNRKDQKCHRSGFGGGWGLCRSLLRRCPTGPGPSHCEGSPIVPDDHESRVVPGTGVDVSDAFTEGRETTSKRLRTSGC